MDSRSPCSYTIGSFGKPWSGEQRVGEDPGLAVCLGSVQQDDLYAAVSLFFYLFHGVARLQIGQVAIIAVQLLLGLIDRGHIRHVPSNKRHSRLDSGVRAAGAGLG